MSGPKQRTRRGLASILSGNLPLWTVFKDLAGSRAMPTKKPPIFRLAGQHRRGGNSFVFLIGRETFFIAGFRVGNGVDKLWPIQTFGRLALRLPSSMVEQLTLNQLVRGSSPRGATTLRFCRRVDAGRLFLIFPSMRSASRRRSSTVEHLFCKQAVAGSNPIAGSILRASGASDGRPPCSPSYGKKIRPKPSVDRAIFRETERIHRRPRRKSAQKISTARWCNGSTNDSDSFCLGSSPSRAASEKNSRPKKAH
jgi:hypothetical protein